MWEGNVLPACNCKPNFNALEAARKELYKSLAQWQLMTWLTTKRKRVDEVDVHRDCSTTYLDITPLYRIIIKERGALLPSLVLVAVPANCHHL